MLVGGTDDGHRAGAYSRLDPGCAAESSPALTLTYLRISLSDNRNLSDGPSRHDAMPGDRIVGWRKALRRISRGKEKL